MIDIVRIKRSLTLYSVLLIVLCVSYFLTGSRPDIRTVDFLRIFAMGALAGGIVVTFGILNRLKKNESNK